MVSEQTNRLTDEEVITQIGEHLQDRVRMGVGYIQDKDSGYLTHHMIQIECGELIARAAPQPLPYPMIPVVEQKGTIH